MHVWDSAAASSAALAALAWIAGPAAAQDEGIVVYTSQHAALTQAWADAFTAETGMPVSDPQGHRHGDGEPDHPGGRQLAGRRVPDRELAGDGAGREGRAVRAGRSRRRWSRSRRSSARRAACGPASPPAPRSSPTTPSSWPRPTCRPRCSTWPRRNGRAAGARRRRGPTSRRSSRRCCSCAARRRPRPGSTGLKQNALAYRGNFEAMRGANVGEVEGALIYQYYYFGDRNGTGESSDKVALHYFGDEDPGAFVSVSGGGVLASSSHPDAGAGLPRLRHRAGGPGDPARRHLVRVPDRQRRRGEPGAAAARRARLSQGRSLAPERRRGRRADDGVGRPLTSGA